MGILSNFRNVLCGEPSNGFNRVNLVDTLIFSYTKNSRKTQCKAALVALGFLDPIECYLDNYSGLNNPNSSVSKLL